MYLSFYIIKCNITALSLGCSEMTVRVDRASAWDEIIVEKWEFLRKRLRPCLKGPKWKGTFFWLLFGVPQLPLWHHRCSLCSMARPHREKHKHQDLGKSFSNWHLLRFNISYHMSQIRLLTRSSIYSLFYGVFLPQIRTKSWDTICSVLKWLLLSNQEIWSHKCELANNQG